MAQFNDLSGNRFDMLLVLHRVENSPDGYVQYLCLCDCGNTKVIKGHNLLNGKTHSCGCLKKKMMAEKQFIHGEAGSRHCQPNRLYRIWRGMVDRCTRPNFRQWKDYGGRGITVCNEWRNDYQNFKQWAYSNGYDDNLTIDRKNNDGNYEPSNCRWIPFEEQMNNRRTNHLLSLNGKTQSMKKWSNEIGINYGTLKSRIKSGWPIERALKDPVIKHGY